MVLRLNLIADAIPASIQRGESCAPHTREGVEDGITGERKHFDEPFCERHRKRRGMAPPRRFALDVTPRRAHPRLHLIFRQHRERALQRARRAILAAFAQEKNVLDIVLNDRARLIGLSVETSAIPFRLGHAVGDFVPKNRGQAIQADFP